MRSFTDIVDTRDFGVEIVLLDKWDTCLHVSQDDI